LVDIIVVRTFPLCWFFIEPFGVDAVVIIYGWIDARGDVV